MPAKLQTDALRNMQTGAAAKTKNKKIDAWKPLKATDLCPGIWIGCDPSYTATGIVALLVRGINVATNLPTPLPEVLSATTIGIKPTASLGWEDDLQRTAELEKQIGSWVSRVAETFTNHDVFYTHEMPVLGGGRFLKPHVGLLSSYAFRRAVETHAPYWWKRQPMVQRNAHATLIAGSPKADKKVEHAALMLLPIMRLETITNEAHRDALCVALFAAHRGP